MPNLTDRTIVSPRDLFDRTVCDCPECSKHCRTMPGNLIPGDIERIAQHTRSAVRTIQAALLASPGALVGKRIGDTIVMGRIPTIVPALSLGRCVFLLPDGNCRIHAVAPYGCAYFDAHMRGEEADERSAAGLRAILVSDEYHRVWKELWQSGRRSLPPEEKRRKHCGRSGCVGNVETLTEGIYW